MYRYHPVWWRKYNYLTGVGLDCGTQIMQTVMVFGINRKISPPHHVLHTVHAANEPHHTVPNASMPPWWGNNPIAPDRCFPPADLPVNAMN